jgi:hypothetical protein
MIIQGVEVIDGLNFSTGHSNFLTICMMALKAFVKYANFRWSYFFVKTSDTEFIQYRRPVGLGPSSNTCPRCAPHLLQVTLIRFILYVLSASSRTLFLLIGCQKLGHPVPLSNLVAELKSSCPQHTQV